MGGTFLAGSCTTPRKNLVVNERAGLRGPQVLTPFFPLSKEGERVSHGLQYRLCNLNALRGSGELWYSSIRHFWDSIIKRTADKNMQIMVALECRPSRRSRLPAACMGCLVEAHARHGKWCVDQRLGLRCVLQRVAD